MNYYEHSVMIKIDIKEFNNAGYLILDISVLNKDFQEEIHSLTVGIHRNELIRYKNYKILLYYLFSKFDSYPQRYINKYGLNDEIILV
jgi:hypothetical protein